MDFNRSKRIAVIGGMNMDIGGRAENRLQLRDSNPGVVSLRPGGVGRNIAQNLRLLGAEVSLLSAVGDDAFGRELLASCEALGMDLSMTLRRPRERSSTYLYVTDDDGDMLFAVSDMDIVDRITPEALAPLMERLNSFDAVVMDANLSRASLCFLAEKLSVPLYADPVSTVKAEKLVPILHRLRALKPNSLEARCLTGEKEAVRAARSLLERGVQRVLLSLGAEGMLAAEGERVLRLARQKVAVVNTTGAGDAATAAMVWADLQGLDLELTARFSQTAGALTCQCQEANSSELAMLPERFGLGCPESGSDL